MEENDETVLARWLEGKLTPAELKEFEGSENYSEYLSIIEGLEHFEKPQYDHGKLKTKLISETDKLQGKSPISFRPWRYPIAAMILLLLGYALFFHKTTYQTKVGGELVQILPDGSTMELAPDTEITRRGLVWSFRRAVTLVKGEALFQVEPGTKFQVHTEHGTVSVLGTLFNIKDRGGSFIAECYQGKIQYTDPLTGEMAILAKGQGISLMDGAIQQREFEKEGPEWVKGYSVFDNIPLGQVLKEMESIYGIQFEGNPSNLDNRFTGAFVHDDLQKALTTVLVPMGVDFEMGTGMTILIRQN